MSTCKKYNIYITFIIYILVLLAELYGNIENIFLIRKKAFSLNY